MNDMIRRSLPSCTVDIDLLKRIERYLFTQIPKLLREDLTRMMRVLDLSTPTTLKDYRILVIDKEGEREFSSAMDMKAEDFSPTIKRLRVELKIGKPQVLSVSFSFSPRENPHLQIVPHGMEARKHAEDISASLGTLVGHWANGNSQFYRRPFKVLLATLPPVSFVALGIWGKVDLFTLLTSQGWLLLLCLLQTSLLPRLYPFVTFVMPKQFSFHRSFFILLFFLNGAAIIAYTGLLALKLDLLTIPNSYADVLKQGLSVIGY